MRESQPRHSRPRHRSTPQRFASWLLLAYLPSLAFFGHWEVPEVPIPGTNYYIGLPAHVAGDHESHCHADAASCSDAPVSAGATVGLLAAAALALGAGGLLIFAPLAERRRSSSREIPPDLRPPRRLLRETGVI